MWELIISYPMNDWNFPGWDRVATILVGTKFGASGAGFGKRDLHFYFDSEKECVAARRRLEQDGNRFTIEKSRIADGK